MKPEYRFAAFILTHGRPDNVITYRFLRSGGFTGPIYLIIDNEDKRAEEYRATFGAEWVKVFDKKRYADMIDEANNFDNRKVIVHARNASFDIADELGLTHFIQLDDDYTYFGYRFEEGAKRIRNLDKAFGFLVDFLESTPTKSIAFSQGGDHFGGFTGTKLMRKCMNSFVCSTSRRFTFLGAINEDVNTYTRRGSVGDLFLTFTSLFLDQAGTQSQAGGMTDIYKRFGTYVKSFSTVLFCPSSVRIGAMGRTEKRLHHRIDWPTTVPVIVPERYRKETT